MSRCGDPLYDPMWAYWDVMSQRHTFGTNTIKTNPEGNITYETEPCDPGTCEGCLAAASGRERKDELQRRAIAAALKLEAKLKEEAAAQEKR